MTVNSRILVAVLIASVGGADHVASARDAGDCQSQVCELTRTLANLNLRDPISDLDRNLRSGDHRFIGINAYSCTAPGAEDAKEPWSQEYGMRCLAGTSDVIEGDAHMTLIGKASSYARAYNSELLNRIRAGLVT